MCNRSISTGRFRDMCNSSIAIISTDGRVETFIINTDGRVKAFSVSDSPLPLGVAGVRVDLEAWAVVQRKTSESEIKINV